MPKNIVRFFTGKNNQHYTDAEAINYVSRYLFNHPENEQVEGINVSNKLEYCQNQMQALKRHYGKEDKRQLAHFTVSNTEFNSLTPEDVADIGIKIANLFGRKYQILMAVNAPTNTSARHLHYMINSVGLDGHKFHMNNRELAEFKAESTRVFEDWKRRRKYMSH